MDGRAACAERTSRPTFDQEPFPRIPHVRIGVLAVQGDFREHAQLVKEGASVGTL